MRKELVAAEAERKLALRHLEQAVHRYAVLVEAVARPLADLDRAEAAALLEDLGGELEAAGVSLEGEDRIALRFQLDVLAALQVLDAPLDELTYWAFRAITNARRVEAMPAATMARLLAGEVARARARRAWIGWDEAEPAKEFAPWPDASR